MEFSMGSVVLDGWKIIRLLGEGSYGRVFEMERTEFGQATEAALMRWQKNHSYTQDGIVDTWILAAMEEAERNWKLRH